MGPKIELELDGRLDDLPDGKCLTVRSWPTQLVLEMAACRTVLHQ